MTFCNISSTRRDWTLTRVSERPWTGLGRVDGYHFVVFVVALIYWQYLTIYDWIPQPTGTIINIVTLSSVKLIEIDRRRPQFVFYIL